MIYDSEIIPSNYTIYRNDRNTRGGGILIAISDNIPSKLYIKDDSIEAQTVKLLTNPPTLLCCIYIPPNCSTDYYDQTLQYLSLLPSDSDLVIVGDFNCPDIN